MQYAPPAMSPRARARSGAAPEAGSIRTSLAAFFRIPSADESTKRWHVSPAIDLAAYAFGWLWIAIPLALLPTTPAGYVIPYLVVLGVTGVHRHFGLPYVYLDRQVRSQHRLRFSVFPALMLGAWLASPWLAEQPIVVPITRVLGIGALVFLVLRALARDGGDPRAPTSPRRSLASAAIGLVAIVIIFAGRSIDAAAHLHGVPIRPLLDLIALAAGVWNVWHFYMQKYGILRMYSAKADSPVKVAGFKDRFLLLSWLPLYFAWIGPRHRDVVLESFGGEDGVLLRVVELLTRIEPVAVPVGFATVAIAIVLWMQAELRANGLRNAPRLLMVAGTTALASCLLWMDPIKAYLAFAFSHAVEYMVFVWAFQRRRYHRALDHQPLLGRVLRRPFVALCAYAGFIVCVGAAFLYVKCYGSTIAPTAGQPRAFGHSLAEWGYYWGIYQSMVHFYFDGFLWKMRLPAVRASI